MHDLSNDELQTTQNYSCTERNAICLSNVCLWYSATILKQENRASNVSDS